MVEEYECDYFEEYFDYFDFWVEGVYEVVFFDVELFDYIFFFSFVRIFLMFFIKLILSFFLV